MYLGNVSLPESHQSVLDEIVGEIENNETIRALEEKDGRIDYQEPADRHRENWA